MCNKGTRDTLKKKKTRERKRNRQTERQKGRAGREGEEEDERIEGKGGTGASWKGSEVERKVSRILPSSAAEGNGVAEEVEIKTEDKKSEMMMDGAVGREGRRGLRETEEYNDRKSEFPLTFDPSTSVTWVPVISGSE